MEGTTELQRIWEERRRDLWNSDRGGWEVPQRYRECENRGGRDLWNIKDERNTPNPR